MSAYPPMVISSPLLDPDYVDSEGQDEPLAGQDHRLTIDYLELGPDGASPGHSWPGDADAPNDACFVKRSLKEAGLIE